MPDKFLLFNVKPIWKLIFPSGLITDTRHPKSPIVIYGVDRGSLDVSRNWVKIHSVEKHNQGFVKTPSDHVFTIAVKEHGEGFEALRRLDFSATMFDIVLDILRTGTSGADIDYNSEGENDTLGYEPWMEGFEKYKGCLVNRIGQTIDIGAFPIREYEIVFLEHALLEENADGTTTEFTEGDGTFPDLDATEMKLSL